MNHYYICKSNEKGEQTCGKIFYNDDDNVCLHCGSKNTTKVGEILYKIKNIWKTYGQN